MNISKMRKEARENLDKIIQNKKYMILAIDFDGTLHTGVFPKIGVPAPYAVETLQKLKADGHYIIINTCRSNGDLLEAINWMLLKRIPFDRVNDNHPDEIALHKNNSRKVYADLYIDDKQVGGLPLWPDIYKYIATFVESEGDFTCENITFPYDFDYVDVQIKQGDDQYLINKIKELMASSASEKLRQDVKDGTLNVIFKQPKQQ